MDDIRKLSLARKDALNRLSACVAGAAANGGTTATTPSTPARSSVFASSNGTAATKKPVQAVQPKKVAATSPRAASVKVCGAGTGGCACEQQQLDSGGKVGELIFKKKRTMFVCLE